jgi:hypothetical protein
MTQVPAQVQKSLSDPNAVSRVAYWEGGGEAGEEEEEEDTRMGPVPVPQVQQQGAVVVVAPPPVKGTVMYLYYIGIIGIIYTYIYYIDIYALH